MHGVKVPYPILDTSSRMEQALGDGKGPSLLGTPIWVLYLLTVYRPRVGKLVLFKCSGPQFTFIPERTVSDQNYGSCSPESKEGIQLMPRQKLDYMDSLMYFKAGSYIYLNSSVLFIHLNTKTGISWEFSFVLLNYKG